MKESGGKQLVECVICGMLVGTVYSYHKHNVRQHSLAQLSRAIIKMRNMTLPLVDPGEESELEIDEQDDEDLCGHIKDPMDILKLPVKVEVMDEVIELAPTDNADHLQIQSRLLNSSDEVNQHSRQVIEVKENNPPPCHLSTLKDDPSAITVKFNKESVVAKDSSCPAVAVPVTRRLKDGSRKVLRATFKSSIDIPDSESFIHDYRKAMSHTSEKYIMQNINPSVPVTKRKRGRPRKNPEHIKENGSNILPDKGESIKMEDELEDESPFIVDPPLFSDDDDDDDLVAMPNIARTRSGRTVKRKKEDGTFDYYDMSVRPQLEVYLKSNRRDKKSCILNKRNKGRKRKMLINTCEEGAKSSYNSAASNQNVNYAVKTSSIKEECDVKYSEDSHSKGDTLNTNKEKTNQSENMNVPCRGKKNENSEKTSTTMTIDTINESVCFLCFKVFSCKEDCEKHMCEHLSKVGTVESANTSYNEHQESNNVDMHEIVVMSTKNTETSEPEEDLDNTHESLSTTKESKKKKEEVFTCSVCNKVFYTKKSFDNHSHKDGHDCKLCGKKYQTKVNLQNHIRKYHEDTDWMKFRCATCGKSFGYLVALERHMKEHNPNQKFCCEQCGKVFKSLANLKNHLPLHTQDEVFRCPYCPKNYYIRYSYEKHIRSHFCPPKYHCEMCNKSFSDKKHFEAHLERHQNGGCLGRSKDLKCNTCGDIKSPTELEIIGEADTGHHKTCLVCGKGHYKKYMLEGADLATLKEKTEREREQCKLCGKYVKDLVRHVKCTHLENSCVPCDVCGIVVTKASLPSHKNRKHGGSAVTCDHCGKAFKNIMCLREHMTKVKKREDSPRTICKICKESVSPELLKDHMTRHKMKCSECGVSDFRNQDEFMAHLEMCRRCDNCGTMEFATREEFLAHVEMCGSSIDIMTGTLDAASDQEVVTSIFAIVDNSTCCGACGEDFEDQLSLANHITEKHPDSLPIDHTLGDNSNGGDSLHACPLETCGGIFTSKNLLSNHLNTTHNS